MAVTRSWEGVRPTLAAETRSGARGSLAWGVLPLAAASLLVTAGLRLVCSAKARELAAAAVGLQRRELLNLNRVESPEQALPFLLFFPDRGERELAADRIVAFVRTNRPLRNVGALSALRLSAAEIERDGRWTTVRLRLDQAAQQNPRRGPAAWRFCLWRA